MSRYDLDKISKLRIRHQNIFNEVLADKIEIHKSFKPRQKYFNHTPYIFPIILKSEVEALKLIDKGIPVVKWPLYPKASMKSSKRFKNIYIYSLEPFH